MRKEVILVLFILSLLLLSSCTFEQPQDMITGDFRFIDVIKNIPLMAEEGSCSDSDGGINLKQKGTTSILKKGAHFPEEIKVDYCGRNGKLVEHYCGRDNKIKSKIETCPEGTVCESGRCIKPINDCLNQECSGKEIDFLIITREMFLGEELDYFINWKKEEFGFNVGVLTLGHIVDNYNEASHMEQIKNAIKIISEENNLKYLLIIGDTEISELNLDNVEEMDDLEKEWNVPTGYALMIDTYDPNDIPSLIFTDSFFADLNKEWKGMGVDSNNYVIYSKSKYDFEITVGRWPVKNSSELSNLISKTMQMKPKNNIEMGVTEEVFEDNQFCTKRYWFSPCGLILSDLPNKISRFSYLNTLEGEKFKEKVLTGDSNFIFLLSNSEEFTLAEEGNIKIDFTLNDFNNFTSIFPLLGIVNSDTSQIYKSNNILLKKILNGEGGPTIILSSSSKQISPAPVDFYKKISEGRTIGEAFYPTDKMIGSRFSNWNLLGDPSLKIFEEPNFLDLTSLNGKTIIKTVGNSEFEIYIAENYESIVINGQAEELYDYKPIKLNGKDFTLTYDMKKIEQLYSASSLKLINYDLNNNTLITVETDPFNTLYENKVSISEDAGENWDVLEESFEKIKINKLNKEIVYGSNGKKLYKSSDGGKTYSLIHEFNFLNIEEVFLDNFQENKLYVILAGVPLIMEQKQLTFGVYISEDGGENFEFNEFEVSEEDKIYVDSRKVWGITQDLQDPNIIYIVGEDGDHTGYSGTPNEKAKSRQYLTFRTLDGGNSYETCSSGLIWHAMAIDNYIDPTNNQTKWVEGIESSYMEKLMNPTTCMWENFTKIENDGGMFGTIVELKINQNNQYISYKGSPDYFLNFIKIDHSEDYGETFNPIWGSPDSLLGLDKGFMRIANGIAANNFILTEDALYLSVYGEIYGGGLFKINLE